MEENRALEEQDEILPWDAVIGGKDGPYLLLQEGDYNFVVGRIRKETLPARNGGVPVPRAVLQLVIPTERGKAFCRLELFLRKTSEWRLCAFFRCIGRKRSGETYRMDWDTVQGMQGRGHFSPVTYLPTDGAEPRTVNRLVRFYDYRPEFFRVRLEAETEKERGEGTET